MLTKRTATSADNFTIVPNRWLRSKALSYKAKGLLAAIQSHQVGYELTIAQLVAQSKDGRDSVRSGLRELEEAGHLRRDQVRNPDGTVGYVWSLVENPDDRGGFPAPAATSENTADSQVATGAGFPPPARIQDRVVRVGVGSGGSVDAVVEDLLGLRCGAPGLGIVGPNLGVHVRRRT